MQRILLEDSLYTRLFTDYSVCLRDGMFTHEEIEQQRLSPSFPREYNLKFLGIEGNVFNFEDLAAAQEEDYPYHLQI
jgi:hypothetical protein